MYNSPASLLKSLLTICHAWLVPEKGCKRIVPRLLYFFRINCSGFAETQKKEMLRVCAELEEREMYEWLF